MDIEQARFNMVEQQIRPWNVLDQDVLNLLSEVHREDYVPREYRSLAFVDMEIPLGHGVAMLAPKMEARMLQELELRKTDRVLEIGTGAGYFTALLARCAHSVTSVEIVPELAEAARRKFIAQRITNVTVEVGDGARGWTGGPYDAIVLTGSTPALPQAFLDALNPGGRMIAIVGDAPAMKAILYRCDSPGHVRATELFETVVPPLRNAQQPERFVF
jgi:protein-L-isoaspartate(D-aspartate) O-methyltransferase